MPPPLVRYRKMRPVTIRKARNDVHKVLWTHADHEFVNRVRKWILDKNEQLAEEISTGELLKGDKLSDALNELGADGPRTLAAVLWASRFNGPHAETLFCSLVPLIVGGVARHGAKPDIPADTRPKSSKGEIRNAKKRLKKAGERIKELERDVLTRDRAVQKSRQDLVNAQQQYQALDQETARLNQQLRETNSALQTYKSAAEKGTRINSDLLRDLNQRKEDLRTLGLERSDLARELAIERGRVQRLKLKLESTEGSEAVSMFLRKEEERKKDKRLISSGADKVRADAELTAHRNLERAFLEAYPQHREPPPAVLRPRAPMRLITLGGSGEVGRSCYLLELGQHRILIDCGIRVSNSDDLHPEIERIDSIDGLILTHAHTDHVGWVPALMRRFPNVGIYCSAATSELLPVMLDDCRRHYVRKTAQARQRARFSRDTRNITEKYEAEDVQRVWKHAVQCNFDVVEGLFGDIRVTFYRAGHILGAASVLIEDESGRRAFFSGDFASFPQKTVSAASWPVELGEIDLLVLESTYGDRPHEPLEDSRNKLISLIRDTVEEKKGSVILPSFALGRAQEILSVIAAARDAGGIPASIPVHVDGMIKDINAIYQRHGEFNLDYQGFNAVDGDSERNEIAFNAQSTPSIIVTTSGMMTGGPVIEYARRLLPDARHRIIFSGFQGEGAPSRALLTDVGAGPRVAKLLDDNGETIEIRAAVPAEKVGLSSHADQPGLLEYASRMRPKHIALVHGEPVAQRTLRERLLLRHPKAHIECGPPELTVQ
ncbi:MAG: MBL fold metallo-hydrolase [Pseudomonas sp.]